MRGSDEVSVTNQESTGRAADARSPYTVGKGNRRLTIVNSVNPAIAAKPKPKNTKKPSYKRV